MGQAGLEASVGYDAAWTEGSAAPADAVLFTTIRRAVDISFSGDTGEADVSSRISGWRLRKNALKDGSISFGLRRTQPVNAAYTFLRDAWINGTPILVALMDLPTVSAASASGWMFAGVIQEFGEEWPHEDGELTSVTIVPTYAEDDQGNLVEPTIVTNPGVP